MAGVNYKAYGKALFYAISFGLAGLLLLWLSGKNYLLFHTSAESAVIVTGISIFLIAHNTQRFVRHGFFHFLGAAYFYISILDFFHALTYKGLNVFPHISANVPTQLWLAFRYLTALSFYVAPYFIGRDLKKRQYLLISVLYFMIDAAILASIFYWKIFPAAYVEGKGLTEFKIVSEYAISLIFVGAAAALYAKRSKLDKSTYRYLTVSLILAVLAELSFTHYVSVYGFFNALGHLFLALSTYFVYKALIEKTLAEPLSLLFQNLNEANRQLSALATQDGLTGLPNRRRVLELIQKQFEIAQGFAKDFCVILLDVDNFKSINDTFGHPAGDEALKHVSRILAGILRKTDIFGRFGGDEFIICPLEADAGVARAIVEKINHALMAGEIPLGKQKFKLSVSAGLAEFNGRQSLDELIEEADREMLFNKKNKKLQTQYMKVV